MSETIRLTYQELALAAIAGILRRVSALQHQRPAAYGYNGNDAWATDIESCAAEMAVAKYLNHFWSPLAKSPKTIPADVGNDNQVRSTPRRDGSLIVHNRDPDDQRYWLVITHQPPEYTLAGWIFGHEAKHDEFWRSTDRPAYFVPQSRLHDPISDQDLQDLLEHGAGLEELNWSKGAG